MISADARSRGWTGWSFVPILWSWPSMILGQLHSAGDQWRRRGVRKIPHSGPAGRSPKGSETIRPIPQNTAIASRVSTPNRVSGACSRSQAWAWQKICLASHRLLRNTARVMCGLTPEMTARRYRKISARVTIETCRIFAGRAPARRQVRCSPAAIAAPRKLLLPPAC